MAELLSIAECRAALSSDEFQNESEIEQLRDEMYTLASTLLEAYDDFRANASLIDTESPLPMDLLASALRTQFEFDDDDYDAFASGDEYGQLRFSQLVLDEVGED